MIWYSFIVHCKMYTVWVDRYLLPFFILQVSMKHHTNALLDGSLVCVCQGPHVKEICWIVDGQIGNDNDIDCEKENGAFVYIHIYTSSNRNKR